MKKNRHHVIPVSRVKGKELQKIVLIDKKQHDLYHQLVSNMLPIEAFMYFNETFWGNKFKIEED